MEMVTQVRIPDSDVSISHNVDILEKGMNPSILSPAMEK